MNLIERYNKNQSHGTFNVPWLTAALTAVCLILYWAGQFIFDLFLFDKVAISQGEFWRVITSHFVHCNWDHLFWDLVGLVILGAVIELNDRRALIPSLLLSCLAVSFWMYFGESAYSTYCGLSGALNGLLVVAVIFQYRATENKMCLLVLILTVLKMIFEFTTHQTIFTSLASQAVPSAHAAGFIAGIIFMIFAKNGRKIAFFKL